MDNITLILPIKWFKNHYLWLNYEDTNLSNISYFIIPLWDRHTVHRKIPRQRRSAPILFHCPHAYQDCLVERRFQSWKCNPGLSCGWQESDQLSHHCCLLCSVWREQEAGAELGDEAAHSAMGLSSTRPNTHFWISWMTLICKSSRNPFWNYFLVKQIIQIALSSFSWSEQDWSFRDQGPLQLLTLLWKTSRHSPETHEIISMAQTFSLWEGWILWALNVCILNLH